MVAIERRLGYKAFLFLIGADFYNPGQSF